MKGNLIITAESQFAFERSIALLARSLRDMRQVAQQMIPEVLVSGGLDIALRELCNSIMRPEGLRIVYESSGLQEFPVSREVAIAVYGIVQELLKNTIQHAAAGKVMVLVKNRNGGFTIAVEDDGKGFDVAVLQQGRGEGWTNIMQKIMELQGRIDTRSARGEGTRVRLELPIA